MTGLIRLTGLIVGLALTASAVAEDDPDVGRELVETCRGCHAIDNYKNVYPTYRVPKLAGQNKEYLVVALKAYASGERSHPTMQSQAKPMSEQDMEAIAAYLSSQGGES